MSFSRVLARFRMPDLMVKHLETLERLSVLTPVEALNATRDGYFSYQFQARITVACPNMDFKDFPMDRQSCDFCFTTMNQRATGAFTFNSRLDGSLWSQRLKEFKADVEPLPAGEAGFRVVVTRQFEVHMLRYYLPCVAIVKVSLVSFIIDPHVVPGRAGLLVTLFLVTFTIFGNIQVWKIFEYVSTANCLFSCTRPSREVSPHCRSTFWPACSSSLPPSSSTPSFSQT